MQMASTCSKSPLDKEYQVNGKTTLSGKSPLQLPSFLEVAMGSSSRKRNISHDVHKSETLYAKKIKACTDQKAVVPGDSDVHLYDWKANEPAAAGDKERQRKFLSLMGWPLFTLLPVSETKSLDDDEASILAAANQHMFSTSLKKKSNDSFKNDGYYTLETMDDAFNIAFKTQNAPMCTCIAHKALSKTSSSTDQAKDKYRQLIRLPQEVNDDTGKKLAVFLIERIFDHLGIKDKTVTPTENGTNWQVDFVLLDNKTRDIVGFKGWGDFCICHQEKDVGAEELLISVGEVESQGTHTAAKLGIYSIGQFTKKTGVPRRYLPSVGIYKDKAAIICIAERTPPDGNSAKDLGKVSFKVVDGADRLDLKCKQGVQEFARKLTATISFALKNN